MKNAENVKQSVESENGEQGNAMVIALLIMVLLMGFVALAVTRTTSETISSANDAAESRVFDACHASLELMTKNFSKVFETSLQVTPADITRIEGQDPEAEFPADFGNFRFNQNIEQTGDTESVILTEGQFQGLTALRDEWEFQSPCRDVNGVTVDLRRRFFNNRIPIFQFGIFYDDDLEFHPGPRFDFGGRVHSNGSMFLNAGTGLYFASKVTARRHIFSDVQKSGRPGTDWGQNVYIRNAAGTPQQLTYGRGSTLTSGTGPQMSGAPIDTLPVTYRNNSWASDHLTIFQGNLLAYQRPLDLPLKINSTIAGQPTDLRELVKRGKAVGDLYNDGVGTVAGGDLIVPVTTTTEDDVVTSRERYYNKTGIRVNFADSKQKLPGCAAATSPLQRCGIRLDGGITGLLGDNDLGYGLEIAAFGRGYQPKQMVGGYQATRLNGNRFHVPGKETWIKVETIAWSTATQTHVTLDITEDILSLGVTERAPDLGLDFQIAGGYIANGTDSRSVIKLQRFMFAGSAMPASGATVPTRYMSPVTPTVAPILANNLTSTSILPVSTTVHNYVRVGDVLATDVCSSAVNPGGSLNKSDAGDYTRTGFVSDQEYRHRKNATMSSLPVGRQACVVPFPINMFDTREGLWNDTTATFNPTATAGTGNYGTNRVPWAGVMSMIDIDVRNLREFLRGTWNANMPAIPLTPVNTALTRALLSTDIPQETGWVFYVSDRRGDYDFDGTHDMEDVYGPNDGTLQAGEDFQKSALQPGFNTVQADYVFFDTVDSKYKGEAVRYRGSTTNTCIAENTCEFSDRAAIFEHPYYRRGVRLVRGELLPGTYDSANADNTRGFTVASENAVYVQGNYNATGVANASGLSQASDYIPQNTADHIPASIAADAVIILSNNWRDAVSFSSPFTLGNRPATQTFMRFAMLGGDTMTSLNGSPNQGGGDPRMNGGVHNFKRFLENWGGQRLSYAGSLINLFNSQNNNGPFKCCDKVYSPPNRNWIFDSSFLDADRIPPGTPFFQSIQITGFQRVN